MRCPHEWVEIHQRQHVRQQLNRSGATELADQVDCEQWRAAVLVRDAGPAVRLGAELQVPLVRTGTCPGCALRLCSTVRAARELCTQAVKAWQSEFGCCTNDASQGGSWVECSSRRFYL
jgi:hypothetical protein